MRAFGKFLGRLLLALLLVGVGIWALAPREPVDLTISFDPALLGDDLDGSLAVSEARYADIVPGTEKQIVWAGPPGVKTPLSVIYLHGFSATLHEIRPVPDQVATALGANLFYTRLAGHGRGGAALAEPVAGDWIEDLAEALAIGRRLGERVIILSTSTGGTLAAIAAADPDLSADVAGIVFVSPNFGINKVASTLLGLPFVRQWGPLVAGAERGFEPKNAAQALYWTTRYPTVAAVPLEALVRHARSLDFTAMTVPALFIYSDLDQVVQPQKTADVAALWGGPMQIYQPVLGPGDDPMAHLITGDIISPAQTALTVDRILDWAKGL